MEFDGMGADTSPLKGRARNDAIQQVLRPVVKIAIGLQIIRGQIRIAEHNLAKRTATDVFLFEYFFKMS